MSTIGKTEKRVIFGPQVCSWSQLAGQPSSPVPSDSTQSKYLILHLFCLNQGRGLSYILRVFHKKNAYISNFGESNNIANVQSLDLSGYSIF